MNSKRKVLIAICALTAVLVAAGSVAAMTGNVVTGKVGANKNTSFVEKSINADKDFIGKEEAKNIALKHAGLSESEVIYTKVELDKDDGVWEYEVDFYKDKVEYDYEVNAVTGKIIKSEAESKGKKVDIASVTEKPIDESNFVGERAAKAAALKHAKLSESEVTFTRATLVKDDGIWEYDVDFYKGNVEYDYEIDAIKGTVISYDTDEEHDIYTGDDSYKYAKSTKSATNDYVGLEKAKAIALSHAGFTQREVTHLTSHFDRDDGKAEYEVEFYKGDMEYSYEIDAIKGTVISYDVEKERDFYNGEDNDDDDYDDDRDEWDD